ncbi:unnamed protein product [Clonostachys chloroleuca]|uniref:GPI inositol-deacylase winged helix domain-containing protein n=1 Tax=Clonostachys chloroleuca TaxID=1926264 RepID=A0AA35VR24_9HYPO|nr:unnamed protein product [Clonostachys chloroleuca]
MQRINSQLEGFKNLAMKVLFWTTCAMRQLTTVELQHALATKLKQSEFDHEDIPLGGLIVRPVHYTTQIFLQTTLESLHPALQSLPTGICISYLSFAEFRAGPCETLEEFEDRLRRNPLYDYAAKNWAHHAIKDPRSVEVVIDFIQNTSTSEAASQVMLVEKTGSWWESKQNFGETLTGMHLAAYFGLDTIQKKLMTTGNSPNEMNNRYKSPIWYATKNGKADTINVLMEAGADVDGRSSVSTTLYEACRIGSLGTVKLLLSAGANIEARSGSWEGYTPLQIAADKGHLEIIESLLAAGADVHATAGALSGVTALQIAADSGHLEIVERMLASGADVDALGNTQYGYTALQVAALRGHLEVVDRLLAAGADANAFRAEDYGDILHFKEQPKEVGLKLLRDLSLKALISMPSLPNSSIPPSKQQLDKDIRKLYTY